MKEHMHKIVAVLFVFLGACSSSLQKNENESIITITIDDPAQEDRIILSYYFLSAQVIPLETTADCLLGEIKKVDIDDGLIFVLDNQKQGVYCFTKEGKYLYRIGSLGNGPKELPDIACFAVDRKNKIVYLHSRIVEKIMKYQYNGDVIGEEPCGYHALDMESFNNRIYLSEPDGSNSYDLVGWDAKGKIIEWHMPSPSAHISHSPIIRKNLICLYYYPNSMENTVYSLNGEGDFEPAILVDIPWHKIPDEVRERMSNVNTGLSSPYENAMEIIRNGYVILSDYAVFPNFIYLSFAYQGQVRWGFYKREQKEFVSSYDIRDDLTPFGFSPTPVVGQTETQLLTWIRADMVDYVERSLRDKDEYMKNMEFTEEQWQTNVYQIELLRKQGVDEDSNPLVIIYAVK